MCEWRNVRGLEGFYLVNELGQVKSADRIVIRNNYQVHRKGKLIQPILKGNKNHEYQYVRLFVNGRCEHRSVHRIVAEAFLPNPDSLPEVNHKDENRMNNRVDNLEWCSRQYNIEYSLNKPIKQILGDAVIAIFESTTHASKKTGICRTGISNALNGRSMTAGGYRWVYCQ